MAISDRVFEAAHWIGEGNFEGALLPACIALDATAAEEYPELKGPRHVGRRCKRFIRENLDLFLYGSDGRPWGKAVMRNVFHDVPGIEKRAAKWIPVEDLICYAVRRQLEHSTGLPDEIVLFNAIGFIVPDKNGRIIFQPLLPVALLAIVIGAKSNADKRCEQEITLRFLREGSIEINKYWGDKAGIVKWIAPAG